VEIACGEATFCAIGQTKSGMGGKGMVLNIQYKRSAACSVVLMHAELLLLARLLCWLDLLGQVVRTAVHALMWYRRSLGNQCPYNGCDILSAPSELRRQRVHVPAEFAIAGNVSPCIVPKRVNVMQMQEKQKRKLNQVAAEEARQAYRDMLKEKRQQQAAAKQRKLENRMKNDSKHGVVVSTATAKKMMKNKKMRKQLVTG
jgi:hypothetical protein